MDTTCGSRNFHLLCILPSVLISNINLLKRKMLKQQQQTLLISTEHSLLFALHTFLIASLK